MRSRLECSAEARTLRSRGNWWKWARPTQTDARRNPPCADNHRWRGRRHRSFRRFHLCKSIASLLSEQTIGVGQIGISKDVSFGWRSPIYGIGSNNRARLFCQDCNVPAPIVRDQLTDREAFFGVSYSRSKILTERQFTEFLVKLEPGIYGTRYIDW